MNIFGKHIYYNVPPCPACGSKITGRYIRSSNYDMKIVSDGLNNGEIIKITTNYNKDRCFCLECNHEWQEHIPPTMVSTERIHEEIENRHIAELQEYYAQIQPPEPKKKFGLF